MLQNIDTFKWVNDYPVLYTNWAVDPNISDVNRRCVELSVSNTGVWSSADCEQQKSFFCRHYEGI